MKLISFENIISADITPYQCYEWVKEGLKNKDEVICPAKISMKPQSKPGVFYNTMPSIVPNTNSAGVKLVTRYPERVPSLDSQILLYDFNTGENLALVDGNWITTMRTGAVAAHSIELLAKNDFSVMGFIGLGNTARACLLVLLELYPERNFTIKLKKYKDQHISFKERFKGYNNLKFLDCETYEEVVSGSDVIVSAATYFDHDVCADEYFKKGVLVVPIHTLGFTNCDLFFDKVFADDTGHVCGFKYFDKFKKFAEVADVVAGKTAGRESDDERILAYNIGISLHDIVFASKLYEICKEECEDITLESPVDKFWI